MRLIKGDIFDSTENIIIHQVNCQGVMGRGLAKEIAQRYPKVLEDYKITCNKYGRDMLGKITGTAISNSRILISIFAQEYWGTNKRQTDYNAFRSCMQSLAEFSKKYNLSIAIPFRIGCNLAGGHWNIIRGILEEELDDCNAVIYRK